MVLSLQEQMETTDFWLRGVGKRAVNIIKGYNDEHPLYTKRFTKEQFTDFAKNELKIEYNPPEESALVDVNLKIERNNQPDLIITKENAQDVGVTLSEEVNTNSERLEKANDIRTKRKRRKRNVEGKLEWLKKKILSD